MHGFECCVEEGKLRAVAVFVIIPGTLDFLELKQISRGHTADSGCAGLNRVPFFAWPVSQHPGHEKVNDVAGDLQFLATEQGQCVSKVFF